MLGGTGRYSNAGGEVTITKLGGENSNNSSLVIRLVHDPVDLRHVEPPALPDGDDVEAAAARVSTLLGAVGGDTAKS